MKEGKSQVPSGQEDPREFWNKEVFLRPEVQQHIEIVQRIAEGTYKVSFNKEKKEVSIKDRDGKNIYFGSSEELHRWFDETMMAPDPEKKEEWH